LQVGLFHPTHTPAVRLAVGNEKVLSYMMLYAGKNGLSNQRILKQFLLSYTPK
jgi:hypothetical protein